MARQKGSPKRKPKTDIKKRKLNRQVVFDFLKKKNLYVTKNSIKKGTKLSLNSIDRACKVLRKMKKIGYLRSSNKTYWGVK